MKRKNTTAAIAFIVMIASCSEDLKKTTSGIPEVVKTSFEKKFPGSSAKWEDEKGKFEASFTWNQEKQSAVFEKDGSFVESEVGIKPNELPQSVRDYMTLHYPNINIKEAARITTAMGTLQYEAAIGGKDIMFDSHSNFLKEVKD